MSVYVVAILLALPTPNVNPKIVPYHKQGQGAYETVITTYPPFKSSLECQKVAEKINKESIGKKLSPTSNQRILGAWCNVLPRNNNEQGS